MDTNNNEVELIALTPSFEKSHRLYRNALDKAVEKKGVYNIALSGGYGVGKSSILEGFAEERSDTIKISLSALDAGIKEHPARLYGRKRQTASSSITNRIQKEVVKQLLYCEPAKRMRFSRFRRISPPRRTHEIAVAILLGLALSLVFIIAGWAGLLLSFFHLPDLLVVHRLAFVALLVVMSSACWACECLLRGHLGSVNLEKISAGSATISLSLASSTYFDEYLDEIMYFFEVSERNIVIFEDIDRFDDPCIFEELRALNGLLNGTSRRLSGKDPSIRFVYAVKDSIFSGKEVPSGEVVDSDRTKFFDLIIPVVPFITHRNSRDLITATLDQEKFPNGISPDLIAILSKHITDMRLVKNIRNEFSIFKAKVLDENGTALGLSEDKIFAMVVYKNIFPADFEKIKSGESKLDELYRNGRDLIKENIRRLDKEKVHLLKDGGNASSLLSRSERFGKRLSSYLNMLLKQAGSGSFGQNAQVILEYEDVQIEESFLMKPDFWSSFASSTSPLTIKLGVPGCSFSSLICSKDDIADTILGESLSEEDWRVQDVGDFHAEMARNEDKRGLLIRASMADLLCHDEFLKFVQGISEDHQPFSYFVYGMHAEMVGELIETGYIDWDFALCISAYYGDCVSARAENFIVHNVERDVMDAYVQLTDDEIKTILHECGDSILSERGAYNISILDFLLANGDSRAEKLTSSLAKLGSAEKEFLQAFLLQSDNGDGLVACLGGRNDGVLAFLSSELEIDDSKRVGLLSVALVNLDSDLDYAVDGRLCDEIQDNYGEMKVFTSDGVSEEQAIKVAGVVSKAGVRFASLKPLAIAVRKAVVQKSAFALTRENLVLALDDEDISLSNIKEKDKVVYAYVLEDLPGYIKAIEEADLKCCSVENPADFVEVVNDVVNHDETVLDKVVSLSPATCIVQHIADVPETVWKVLAKHGRFPTTMENVAGYIGSIGKVDSGLSKLLLKAQVIDGADGFEEAAKENLAKMLLGAKGKIPNPEDRVKLVYSLGMENHLAAGQLEVEGGHFVGCLIENGIVADDAEVFTLVPEGDWSALEYAISKSDDFESFMTPTEVAALDVLDLINSRNVRLAVKKVVVENLRNYTYECDVDDLSRIAKSAMDEDMVLPFEEVCYLAKSGVDPEIVIKALDPSLSKIDAPNLQRLLQLLGGKYAVISERNGRSHQKIAATPEHERLVFRLEELQIVNSHVSKGGNISVNLKKSIG